MTTRDDILKAVYSGYENEIEEENRSDDKTISLRPYFRWNQENYVAEVVESPNNFEQINLQLKYKTVK